MSELLTGVWGGGGRAGTQFCQHIQATSSGFPAHCHQSNLLILTTDPCGRQHEALVLYRTHTTTRATRNQDLDKDAHSGFLV